MFTFEELIQQQTIPVENNQNGNLQTQIDELKQMILAMGQTNSQQNQPKDQKRGNNR